MRQIGEMRKNTRREYNEKCKKMLVKVVKLIEIRKYSW